MKAGDALLPLTLAMALREVLQFPDPRLKRVCEPIEKIDDAIRELAADMLEVMYDEPGIGLAALQVGEPVRLIVLDTKREPSEARWRSSIRRSSSAMEPSPGARAASPSPTSRPRWSGPRGSGSEDSIWTARSGSRRQRSCAPCAFSMRSITWTVCSSSTESAG